VETGFFVYFSGVEMMGVPVRPRRNTSPVFAAAKDAGFAFSIFVKINNSNGADTDVRAAA